MPFFESACRSKSCLEHDLFRKPVSSPDQVRASLFRDHALTAEHHRQLLAAALDGDPPQASSLAGGAIEVARACNAFIVDAEDAVAALEAEILCQRAVGDLDDHHAAG